jgi:hypothetical protein
MNRDLMVRFVKMGIDGVRCRPHPAIGMLALIGVGDGAGNEQAAKAVSSPDWRKRSLLCVPSAGEKL